MSNRYRTAFCIKCHYLSYTDPKTGITHKLPMIHIRMMHGTVGFSTVGLVDSGATTTFIPTEMAQILGLDLTVKPEDAIGAGGIFQNTASRLEKLFLYKGRNSPFADFENVFVQVPVKPDAIPYVVLGRDTLFRKFDITFEERNEKIILKRHR